MLFCSIRSSFLISETALLTLQPDSLDIFLTKLLLGSAPQIPLAHARAVQTTASAQAREGFRRYRKASDSKGPSTHPAPRLTRTPLAPGAAGLQPDGRPRPPRPAPALHTLGSPLAPQRARRLVPAGALRHVPWHGRTWTRCSRRARGWCSTCAASAWASCSRPPSTAASRCPDPTHSLDPSLYLACCPPTPTPTPTPTPSIPTPPLSPPATPRER